MKDSKGIFWKFSSCRLDVASVRYRGVIPAVYLEEKNIKSHFYERNNAMDFSKASTVIFVKSFTDHDVEEAKRARASNINVILDLCDNIFVEEYISPLGFRPSVNFIVMAAYANSIITTCCALKEKILDAIDADIPVFVIEDGIETNSDIIKCKNMISRELKKEKKSFDFKLIVKVLRKIHRRKKELKKNLRRWVKRHLKFLQWKKDFYKINKARKNLFVKKIVKKNEENIDIFSGHEKVLIWFGHSGSPPNSGLDSLTIMQNDLEECAKAIDFKVIVISNNYEKYEKVMSPFKVKHSYIEWKADTIESYIKKCDGVLIPNNMDNFNSCKSSNRTSMVLALGKPVIATKTKALEGFDDCCYFEPWLQSLESVFLDPEKTISKLEHFNKNVKKNFTWDKLANKWEQVIQIKPPKIASGFKDSESCNIVFFLDLIQDLDMLLPIIMGCSSQENISCKIWVSDWLKKHSPRVVEALLNNNFNYIFVSRIQMRLHIIPKLENVNAVFTSVESSLGPHRAGHNLVKKAISYNIKTYTLQHGFENIGLTFFDKKHSGKIDILSETIFIWGTKETLSSEVSKARRKKCISVGSLKENAKVDELQFVHNGKFLVSIYENLHWHRYSEKYREAFVYDLEKVIKAHPDVTFILKPHHAGRWISKEYKGKIPKSKNLIYADPLDNKWEKYTAPSIIQLSDGVITSPSTVALDAAQLNCPVAVTGYDLELKLYDPLLILRETEDWVSYVDKIKNKAEAAKLKLKGEAFKEKVCIPGDAVSRVLKCVLEDFAKV